MRLLLLKVKSRNDVLQVFIERLAGEFERIAGVEVTTIDLTLFSGYQLRDFTALFSGYEAVISFNAIHADLCVEIEGSNRYFFDLLKIRHVCWMVDDVVYHLARLQPPNPNRITLCTSEQHIQTAKSLGLDGIWLQSLVAGYNVSFVTKPHAERRYDVVIAASWMGEPKKFWLHFENNIQQAIEETLSCLENAIICNAFPLFSKKIQKLNLSLTDHTLQYMLSEIHSYIRKKDRRVMIDQIIHSGVSIALIGSGWTELCYRKSNVTIVEDLNYADVAEIYQDARVVVNLNAENGASERVFDGIANGAMVFSDFSNALYRIFSHDNGVLFYQKNRAEESIRSLVRLLMQGETQKLAHQAQQIVANGNMWKHRAEEIYHLLTVNN